MISSNKAIECAETLIKFCGEQNGCQNCIFRENRCDRWECYFRAIDLKYELSNIKANAEAKKRNHGYL